MTNEEMMDLLEQAKTLLKATKDLLWNGDEDRRITIWASIYDKVELYYRP